MVVNALIGREDEKLKVAYDRFHDLVRQEQGVVRNAILMGIEGLKTNSRTLQSDVKENLSLTRDLSEDTKSMQTDTAYARRAAEGKRAFILLYNCPLRCPSRPIPSPTPQQLSFGYVVAPCPLYQYYLSPIVLAVASSDLQSRSNQPTRESGDAEVAIRP